jgi:hypothetical protein
MTKTVKYGCSDQTCCPLFRLTEGGWLIIFDDFGGSIKIKADKELLIKTIEQLFNQEEK